MNRPQPPKPSFRIGVDFGFRFTGLALVDDARAREVVVLEHRTGPADISKKLQERRENRAMRRRARSRRKRLRDFCALLKEMRLKPVLPAQSEQDKNRHGNRLYAVAHWRGWDYADIVELLMQENDDKPPAPAPKVRDIDDSTGDKAVSNSHCNARHADGGGIAFRQKR